MKKLIRLTAVLVFTWAATASAGVIYTDQAAFDTAVAGLSVAGTENFDALSVGLVNNPDAFMNGLIEIGDTSPGIYATGVCVSCPNEWLANFNSSINPVKITGSGGAAMGFNAFALPNRKQFTGTWSFLTSLGLDSLSQDSNFFYSFLGWVGTGSETLVQVSYNTGGIGFDSLVAYSSGVTTGALTIPAPGTLALVGLGLIRLAWCRRRKAKISL